MDLDNSSDYVDRYGSNISINLSGPFDIYTRLETMATIIGSDNHLPPVQRRGIIWINVGLLPIVPLRTNSNEIWIQNTNHENETKCRLQNCGKVVSASKCPEAEIYISI